MPHDHSIISARTRLLAVIGHPVEHSLSPIIQNAALRHHGVDAVYLAFDVEPSRLSCALDGLRAVGLWGANITLPHKEVAIALVDEIHPAAAAVGAVNTIVNREGILTGYNTDIQGFVAALAKVGHTEMSWAGCLVLGAGGAARAVVAALVGMAAREIHVYNRTEERAEALCAAATEWGAGGCRIVSSRDLLDVARSADLIVNATSVGLRASVKESPISVDTVHSHHLVIDLVYGGRRTHLVNEAIARGAVAIDGLEMLIAQAAESYRLWTDLDAPVEVMRASVEKAGRWSARNAGTTSGDNTARPLE